MLPTIHTSGDVEDGAGAIACPGCQESHNLRHLFGLTETTQRDLLKDTGSDLVGQLSRRGYGGAVAMEAARRALDEHRGARGVRFS